MNKHGFPDCVYARAADAFRASCVGTSPDYSVTACASSTHSAGHNRSNKLNEVLANELAFNALKFRVLLEDVLLDCCFQANQQLLDDLMALAMVMLYDLQDRKFLPREPMTGEGEEPVEEVRLVEDSLFRLRTKLAASLARCRIKQDLVCIDDILPKSVKLKHKMKDKLPTCAWVNTLKSSMDEVCMMLKTQGFIQVDPHTHLKGSVFCKDTHCPDVLLFPHNARERLDQSTLFTDHTLIIQEKSRSLAVCALRLLLPPVENRDVLIAGSFSAHTVAHVAVQASVFSNNVYVCGVPADSAQWEELHLTLSRIGCTNVRVLSEEFAELSEGDSRLQRVRVVLMLPRCTASALADPVSHIINEDGDTKLLWDLSQGAVSDTKLESLTRKQIQDLSRALTLPKVHGVVYCTCSVYEEENELVVRRALKNAAVKSQSRPFRIISTDWTDNERFFRMQASGLGDGCFLCVLKREETESVQDILVRAAAKGLLNGLTLPEKVKKPKTKDTQRKALATPPIPDSSVAGDPSVNKQLQADPSVPEGALVHTSDSHCPSHDMNNHAADQQSLDSAAEMVKSLLVKDSVSKGQKKQHRRKPRAPKDKGVKSKSRGTQHRRKMSLSRKKQPRLTTNTTRIHQ